jgi:hypothetical protein
MTPGAVADPRAVHYALAVKRILSGAIAAVAVGGLVTAASAQVIPPLSIGGPAQGAMQQLHPPTPLQQVREQSLKRSAPLPPPAVAAERWVPDRTVFVPEFNRTLLIPGHYEKRITDQQYAVPTIRALDPATGVTVVIPGSDRPPADLRTGP